MKHVIIILLLLISIPLMSTEIEADKGWHFTGTCSAVILLDLCGLPWYCTLLTVSAISVGKELNDPFFSVPDLYADGLGICFGFAVRW